MGSGLTFSFEWKFALISRHLTALSLLISIAIIRTLKIFDIHKIKVKWPNDILYENKKLAGILIEGWQDLSGHYTAVIGIGINFKLSCDTKLAIDQEATDLFQLTGKYLDRNQLLAYLLKELVNLLTEFERFGFEPFKNEWISHHVYHGKLVKLLNPDKSFITGIVEGIHDDGSLVLLTDDGIKSFVIGEISLQSSF